jgi:hypothetical protein
MIFNRKNEILFIVAILLFLIASFYGLIIRWNFAFPTEVINYKNILQAHSHVAFLGWGYLVSLLLINHLFIKEKLTLLKIYNIAITIIIIAVTLMLISFPIVGYKSISIVLLSVFGVTSYVISFQLLRHINGKSVPIKLIRFGIYYYLLSSLATWFLAFVIITQGKSALFYNTIYFYLHFLYNGYFVFVLFGLLFKLFENQHLIISKQNQNRFFIFLNIACVPAYALSILWSKVPIVFNYIGFVAATLQLFSLYYLLKIIKEIFKDLKWSYFTKLLLKFVIISYTVKICIQVISAFPYVVSKSLVLKHFFIIGYLHLFTLGFMTVMIFLLLIQIKKILIDTSISKIGLIIFLTGIIGTEFLLFYQGFLFVFKFSPLKYYNMEMLFFSILLFIGLILVFLLSLKKNLNFKKSCQ